MQLMTLLHKTFEKELAFIHKARFKNLMDVCATATQSNKLYLTGLGRELINNNKTSSNIQKVDRLLGNRHLQKERKDFYKVMISYLIKHNSQPRLLVDWTCINSITNLYALRASLSMSGRSIVIYEECHLQEKENNHNTHKNFLNELKKMLPKSAKPIIVTDAGFRAPWFTHVCSLGWDFVGRLRNKNLVLLEHKSTWQLSSTFFEQAMGKPTYIGSGLLTEQLKVPAHFVVYKKKNRHKVNKKTRRSSKDKLYSNANREPWVLVTSLALSKDIAKTTVTIYRQRMQIEENIRDTKSPHYGLGLTKSLSRSKERMSVLLLIGAIATFAAWLAGLFTTYNGNASDFQAQSSKFTTALSKVYLGREALKRGLAISKKQFDFTLAMLYQLSIDMQKESIF